MSHAWVLVIDDERDLRECLCELLSEENYTVSAAADGAEALAIMSQRRPDLVIMDLRMPRKSGWDLMRSMRENTELSAVPVIVLSANLSTPPPGDAVWLKKPVSPDLLLTTVRGLTRRGQ
jgi:DNA-binding response OmpR family regulator